MNDFEDEEYEKYDVKDAVYLISWYMLQYRIL